MGKLRTFNHWFAFRTTVY